MSRKRTLVVASLPVVLAGAILALAGGSGGGTAGKGAAAGLVRATSSGTPQSSLASAGISGTFGPHVSQGLYQGVSPDVSSLPVLPVSAGPLHTRDNESLRPGAAPPGTKDPVVQKKKGSGPISAPIQNFDGICLPFGPPCAQASSCSCLPPDTNGEVGATQYVQTVNSDFAVYSKTGTALRGATPINQLWANAGGECAAHNDGDPVVVYDQLAKRWLLSEFIATPSGNPGDDQYGECIAVSTTGDATGSYYLYTFLFGSDVFYDYPKLGVWPDGYYMMANEFPTNSETSAGVGAFAFERSQMLAGKPARVVFFDESQHNSPGGQYIGMLPSDLDGSTLPPAGSPNWFAEVDDPTGVPPTTVGDTGFDMHLWAFHVDWANPANSTFGNDGAPSASLPVAQFVRPQCVYGYGDCAPQAGGPQQLDVLGDRLMFRLAYRNFGGYASLVSEPLGAGQRPDRNPLVRGADPEGRHAVDLPAGNVRARRRDESPLALDGLDRRGPKRRHRARVQRLWAERLSIRPLHRPRCRRHARADDAGRAGRLHGHRPADGGRGPLGRLQRPDRRPERRLHLLVHAGVPGDRRGRARDLAHPRRLVQVPRLQEIASHRTGARFRARAGPPADGRQTSYPVDRGMANLFGYIDPGSGSLFLQGLAGGIAAIGVFLKVYWRRVKRFLHIGKPEDESSESSSS